MAIDDLFQRRLRDIAARFHNWSLAHQANAQFVHEDANGYWRFAGTPVPPNACAFEILIHPNNKVDFLIADQTYEERSLEPLEQILPLVEAIAAGQVLTRSWSSSNTGMLQRIETIITLDGVAPWCEARDITATINQTAAPRQKRDRHYVPYTR